MSSALGANYRSRVVSNANLPPLYKSRNNLNPAPLSPPPQQEPPPSLTVLEQFLQVVWIACQLQKQSTALDLVGKILVQHIQVLVNIIDVCRVIYLCGIYPWVLWFIGELGFS